MTTLEELTGPFVSLAGRLGSARCPPEEPAVGRIFCADVTHAQAFGSGVSWYCGVGRDTHRDVAVAAAVGEAFERYGLRDLDDTRTRTASPAELASQGERFLSPAELAAVHEPGEATARLRPPPAGDTPIRWLPAQDLVTGDPVFVPAMYCIYLEHGCDGCGREHGEAPWCLPTSNGTAAGTSPVEACLSGLLELVERDAFMLMWYHRLRFPFLRIDPHTRLGQRIDGMFGRARVEVRFLDLTEVHGVPVVVAVARGNSRGEPVFAIGGSAGLDLTTAVWKAAREVAGLYTLARGETVHGRARRLTPERVARFEDHLRYYADPAHQRELDFLLAERDGPPVPVPRATDPPPAADALRRLTSRLREDDIRSYAVDLTPVGAPSGLHSYKVVSPDLIPLDFHHQVRHLNRPRLLTEPTRRGWRPDQPGLDQLNHAPHPFP
ncbi:YcaO-like family protein [Streptomyces sp. DSM 44915]|uniref:YcaO-like family protein n=1 Tax=Streptomyces chisholmiae TaxID=3075540 RepID=A0ABU2JNE2_9ACTN|nr:YcaO-like family protein [Streptomyces sp. DSM 44915]MDT0266510.1 YcaO-like family protein [Streptomyces sp. DSM 44915]